MDNPHAVAVDIGNIIKPIPVRLNVIELDVVATIKIVSNDLNIVVKILFLFILLFRFILLTFDVSDHLFDVDDVNIKIIYGI